MRLTFVLLLTCSCSSYFTAVGRDAANGAVDAATSPDATKRFSKLASDIGSSAATGAVGPETNAAIQKIVLNTGDSLRREVDSLITTTLQERIRQTVRLTMDEALGQRTLVEVAALRDEVLQPLPGQIDAIIDSAAPHLAQAVQSAVNGVLLPVQQKADAEAAKWKPIAIWFAVGSGVLALALVAAAFVLRRHAKAITELKRAYRLPAA